MMPAGLAQGAGRVRAADGPFRRLGAWCWRVLPLLFMAGTALSLPPDRSLRSTQLLYFDCSSNLGRREITLFGNGTVRLREGLRGQEVMYLGELGPRELQGYLNRLAQEDLVEAERRYWSVEGDWVEECTLELKLAHGEPRAFRFRRYDSLSLPLNRVLLVALELADEVDRRPGADSLPADYEPRVGDRLQRVDGEVFEVVGFTADNRGVELNGIDQPLTLYVLKDELARLFVSLESRW